MPLTKEERHALATRVRLGETMDVAGKRVHQYHPWRTISGGEPISVLGVQIMGASSMTNSGPRRRAAVWEDGTEYRGPWLGSELSAAIIEYLERE